MVYPTPPAAPLPPLHPASFPSPAPSSVTENDGRGRSQSLRQTLQQPSPGANNHFNLTANAFRGSPSRSPSLGSECCGGLIDCTDLADEEYDELQDDEELATSFVRTSGVRSTSDEMDVHHQL